jgi:AcrR family transcriptional regulator
MGRHPDPQRRSELLSAVADYVLAEGLADLSLRPLAAAIGTSPRMLLYHFESKERLVVDVLAEVRGREAALFSGWGARPGSAQPEELVDDVWSWLSAPETAPFLRLFFHVYGLALENPERYPGFLDHAVADWLGLLSDRVEQAGVAPAAAREAATLVLAVARGLLLDLLVTGDRQRIGTALDSLKRGVREHLSKSEIVA